MNIIRWLLFSGVLICTIQTCSPGHYYRADGCLDAKAETELYLFLPDSVTEVLKITAKPGQKLAILLDWFEQDPGLYPEQSRLILQTLGNCSVQKTRNGRFNQARTLYFEAQSVLQESSGSINLETHINELTRAELLLPEGRKTYWRPRIYNLMASFYAMNRQFAKSLELLKKAEDILSAEEAGKEPLQQQRLLAEVYRVRGYAVYDAPDSPEDAFAWFEKSRRLALAAGDEKSLALAHLNLSLSNKHNIAVYHFEEALKIYRQRGDTFLLSRTLFDYGHYYLDHFKSQSEDVDAPPSLALLDTSLQHFTNSLDLYPGNSGRTHSLMGVALHYQSKYKRDTPEQSAQLLDSASQFYNRALDIASKKRDFSSLKELLYNLSTLCNSDASCLQI